MPSRCSICDSSVPAGPPPTIATCVRSIMRPPRRSTLSAAHRQGNRRRDLSLSKQLEIFAMLPVRDLGLEAIDLGILDVDVVVHERRAQRVAEERVVVKREHRLPQALWQ